jgi:hypothetical protein
MWNRWLRPGLWLVLRAGTGLGGDLRRATGALERLSDASMDAPVMDAHEGRYQRLEVTSARLVRRALASDVVTASSVTAGCGDPVGAGVSKSPAL